MNVKVSSYAHYTKKTLNIAWPVIFESIMISVVQFADTIMVGALGPLATAAVGINASPTWLLNALPIIFSVGGTVFVARHTGAREQEEAEKVVANVMFFAFLSSIFLGIIMLFLSGFIPSWMGAEPDVLPLSQTYFKIFSIGIPFTFMAVVASGLLRGAGNTRTPMIIALISNIINIIGNFLLIYETRPVMLPFINKEIVIVGAGMGVSGAATATIISQIFMGVVIVSLLFKKNSVIKLKISELKKPNLLILKRVLDVGLPASLERISVSLGQVVYQRMISELGTVQVSAHYLAIIAESVSYMPASGFAVAATTLVGQSLGAKDKKAASSYGTVSVMFSLIWGFACCILFLLFAMQLLTIFSPDPDVIREGAAVIKLIAIVEPLFSLSIVLIGILRGAGDTRIPFFAAIFGMWGIRLISTWLFVFVFHLGLPGAWIGMGIDISARAIYLYIRYKSKKWLDIVI